ncbi:MAG TPA: FkbM family methyltransferase [Candidatus Saccharimonadales bacterium]
MKNYTVSYAQNREDIILSCFFDDDEKGFYVDVGANEPMHESVTKYFYDRGWHGINIEPIPRLHQKLVIQRPNDINLPIGVSKKPGQFTLHYYPNGDGLSTMSETMASSYRTGTSKFTEVEEEIVVDTLPLKDIFKKHVKNNQIYFMKVDVEGFEYEVLSGNDWEKYRPQVICIEANHVDKDWRPLLIKQNYSLVFADGLNEYYVDNSTDRAKKFDYVKGVIFREPIVNFRLLKDFKAHDDLVTTLEKNNTELRAELEKSQAERQQLQHSFNEIASLRRHVKRNVKHRLSHVDHAIQQKLIKANNFKPMPLPDSLPTTAKERLSLAHLNDQTDFTRFNESPKQHPALPAYRKARKLVNKTRKGL